MVTRRGGAKAKANVAKLRERAAKFRAWQEEASVHDCSQHAVRGDDGAWECDECGAVLRAARRAV